MLIAWLPLLFLSALGGNAVGHQVQLPLLYDIEMQARLLVTLPLLILAEAFVAARLRPITRQFSERGLIPRHAQAQFDTALRSAYRFECSCLAELIMLGAVFVVGACILWQLHPLELSSWHHGGGTDGRASPTLAGWWMR